MKFSHTTLVSFVIASLASHAPALHAEPLPYSSAPLIVQRQHPVILPDDPLPAIHGPLKIGCTPGNTLFYRVPATGQSPLTFKASGLPPGLTINSTTGVITGSCAKTETDTAKITVSNTKGASSVKLTIVSAAGSLALTPPMGWSALGLYGETEDDTKIRDAADAMNATGLAAHGWRTILVDDSWQGARNPAGQILPNRRFPDMKGLGSYIHSKGLQFGLYSAPTQHSCSGYTGSLGYEAQDARTFAGWGIDYLKYEWCPVDIDTQKPPASLPDAYALMRKQIDATGRDVVYNVSTNGQQDPWDWAADAGANTYTTGGIIPDDWKTYTDSLMLYISLADQGSTGHWIDPGPLLVGRSDYGNVHSSNFTPSEQMYQFSMLCLLPAPLFLNCDLDRLNPNKFNKTTTALLTNDEVIGIDQDSLGAIGQETSGGRGIDVWFKLLADGAVAVGLFNKTNFMHTGTVSFSDINLSGTQPVRDLWMHKDLANATDTFTQDVPPHGVVLVKIGKPQPGTPK